MTKGDDTRQAILRGGLALASEVGLEGLSIGALAAHVHMSKSGLFAHFQSKENLQVAVLDEAASVFLERVVSPALQVRRGEPRVRALIEQWLHWADDDTMPGGCIFFAAISELDDRPGPARERLRELQEEWIATLAGAVRRAVAEGHFRKDLDPEQLAFELYCLAPGYHTVNRLIQDPRARDRVHAALARLFRDAQVQPPPTRRPKG